MQGFRCAVAVVVALFVVLGISFSPAPAAEYDVYAKIEHFTWEEFDNGSRILEESGPLFGVGASGTYAPYREWTLKWRAELFGGQVDYDGQTNLGTPLETDTNYFGTKLEGDAGWRIRLQTGSFVEPFIGLGYRWWIRDIESTSTAIGVEEVWQTFYGRVGLRGEAMLSKTTKVFAEAAARFPFYNENEVDLSDLGLGGDVSLKPGKRVSAFAEAGFKYRLIKASVYYESLRFSESSVVDIGGGLGVFQPKSEADIFGLNVGVSF